MTFSLLGVISVYSPWEPWSCDQCIRKKNLSDMGKKDNKHPAPPCLPASTRKANPPGGKLPLAPCVFMWSVSMLPGKHVSQPFKALSSCYLGIPCSNCPFQLYAVILRVMPSTCYWTLLAVDCWYEQIICSHPTWDSTFHPASFIIRQAFACANQGGKA